jgi:hypothetical protein
MIESTPFLSLNEKTAEALNATNPDLHDFQARRGKLIPRTYATLASKTPVSTVRPCFICTKIR